MGDVLYHMVVFAVEELGFTVRRRGELPAPISEVDPEPEMRFCGECNAITTWATHRWVLENEDYYGCVVCE